MPLHRAMVYIVRSPRTQFPKPAALIVSRTTMWGERCNWERLRRSVSSFEVVGFCLVGGFVAGCVAIGCFIVVVVD